VIAACESDHSSDPRLFILRMLCASVVECECVRLAGYGPPVAGVMGKRTWICSAGDSASGVWLPVNQTIAPLLCVPCTPGFMCPGGDSYGEKAPCPAATFSGAAAASCTNCPSCCAQCDATTGQCAAGSQIGCKIDGHCWPPLGERPLSDGCSICQPAMNASAWSRLPAGTVCGASNSTCFPPKR
jgi:hypothetical protein